MQRTYNLQQDGAFRAVVAVAADAMRAWSGLSEVAAALVVAGRGEEAAIYREAADAVNLAACALQDAVAALRNRPVPTIHDALEGRR